MYYQPENDPFHTSNKQVSPSVPPAPQYPSSYQPMYPPPPVPGQFYPSPPQPPNNSSAPYSRAILFILLSSYTAFLFFVFIAAAFPSNGFAIFLGRIGISLLWGMLVSVFMIDRRGFFTLNGWIRWRQATGGKRILLGLLFLCTFPVLLGIYFVRVFLMSRRLSQQTTGGPIPVPSRRPRGGIVIGTLVALFMLFIYSVGNTSATDLESTNTPSSTISPTATHFVATRPTSQATRIVPRPTVAPTKAPSPTPTMRPTAVPTHPPTPTPIPQPTQAQTIGVNGNPWGYNFQPGNFIYDPPATFCDYFNCIASFWKSTNGYVDECSDATYSHSGGVSGACSRHGGEMRPLYSH